MRHYEAARTLTGCGWPACLSAGFRLYGARCGGPGSQAGADTRRETRPQLYDGQSAH